jgi:hypothetical protein
MHTHFDPAITLLRISSTGILSHVHETYTNPFITVLLRIVPSPKKGNKLMYNNQEMVK